MRVLRTTVIGLVVFTLAFLFLPTGQDGNATVDNFMLTTSYATAYNTQSARLVSSYAEEPYVEDNTELTPSSTTTVIAQSGYLFCDKDGNGIEGHITSHISANREGSLHNGEDIVPVGGLGKYGPNEVFAVCPFPGTVVSAGYDGANLHSMGYNVRVQITKHVDIVYMHLGYGAGKAVQYSSYTTKEKLVRDNPCQAVGYPDQWVTEEEWCKEHGVKWKGVARWVGPSSIRVQAGDVITAGAVIGVPGDTGNSTGIHSHFCLRYVDDSGTKYYGSISEVLDGANVKDIEWLCANGTGPKTASQWGWDLAELDMQIQK